MCALLMQNITPRGRGIVQGGQTLEPKKKLDLEPLTVNRMSGKFLNLLRSLFSCVENGDNAACLTRLS